MLCCSWWLVIQDLRELQNKLFKNEWSFLLTASQQLYLRSRRNCFTRVSLVSLDVNRTVSTRLEIDVTNIAISKTIQKKVSLTLNSSKKRIRLLLRSFVSTKILIDEKSQSKKKRENWIICESKLIVYSEKLTKFLLVYKKTLLF